MKSIKIKIVSCSILLYSSALSKITFPFVNWFHLAVFTFKIFFYSVFAPNTLIFVRILMQVHIDISCQIWYAVPHFYFGVLVFYFILFLFVRIYFFLSLKKDKNVLCVCISMKFYKLFARKFVLFLICTLLT